MKSTPDKWKIKDLLENLKDIEFPEFQREPNIWDLPKKKKLIDSIFRGFDISSIYLFQKEEGGFDVIDGRQRMTAILSYVGINEITDKQHNAFNLEIENEIYSEGRVFEEINTLRYEDIPNEWKEKFLNYAFNVVLIGEVERDEELNLLFLRLQIASLLNAGEKLHAMTGEMQEKVFSVLSKHDFFKRINVPSRRFYKEQVAGQITINVFSLRDKGIYQRCRFIDLQGFFKEYSTLKDDDNVLVENIIQKLDIITKHFDQKLAIIKNRALALSIYLFVSQLIDDNKEKEIDLFIEFIEKLIRTIKWQTPKMLRMDREYERIISFQANITQAASEKYTIENRHGALKEYFAHYKEHREIIGDSDYKEKHGKDPNNERDKIILVKPE